MIGPFLVGLVMMLAPATAPSTGPATASKADVLAAIDRFMANPTNGDDAKLIVKFASDSDTVMVEVDHSVLTWLQRESPYEVSPVLTAAFFAGNVKSQLQRGKTEDDAYAGVMAVLDVYKKLCAANKVLYIAEVEELAAIEKRGELKAYLDDAAKNRTR